MIPVALIAVAMFMLSTDNTDGLEVDVVTATPEILNPYDPLELGRIKPLKRSLFLELENVEGVITPSPALAIT